MCYVSPLYWAQVRVSCINSFNRDSIYFKICFYTQHFSTCRRYESTVGLDTLARRLLLTFLSRFDLPRFDGLLLALWPGIWTIQDLFVARYITGNIWLYRWRCWHMVLTQRHLCKLSTTTMTLDCAACVALN